MENFVGHASNFFFLYNFTTVCLKQLKFVGSLFNIKVVTIV